MSAQTEHTTEESEAETHAADQSSEQSKSESSMLNNQTGVAMLEDEEMPTYISVSSPSRREDNDPSTAKQQERITMEEDRSESPYRSDDQGADSIYVVSSEEDSNHPPYSDDDDEDDCKDSDEMEDEEEEDEDDDEDEALLRMPDDEDDEFELDYDPDCNDRASDDLLLINRLKKDHKEKSLSLQDLNVCKGNSPMQQSRKRHSLNLFERNVSAEQNALAYAMAQKRRPGMFRNHFVKSKVKLYIENLKEQSRKSLEKRMRDQEIHLNKNHIENQNAELEEQPKSTPTTRVIKDYAEKVLKDLQSDENAENDSRVYNAERIVENGNENISDLKLTETEQNKMEMDVVEADIYCESVQTDKDKVECDRLLEKPNGSVDIENCEIQQETFPDKDIKLNSVSESCVINGHQTVPSYFNVRTLTYDEYMQGVPNNYQKDETKEQPDELQESESTKMIVSDPELIVSSKIDQGRTDDILDSEDGKKMEISIDEENINFPKPSHNNILPESIEIMNLKAQLSQKTIECNNLHDAYQKTVAENLRMKQEIETLRNSLTKYESENKPRETNVASIQTEAVIERMEKQEVNREVKEINNKKSTSSVASTISSIEQWADSACSPAISLKPPDLTALNSDDSMVLTNGTPRRTVRPSLSKAFITSSRILQTLSTIAQGKLNSDSTPVNSSKKCATETPVDHHFTPNYDSPIQASSSKKRKATDMLGGSTFLQPFKIPHTVSKSASRRLSSTVDTEYKYAEETADSKSEECDRTAANAKSLNTESSEDITQDDEDQDSNIKCFVYREDENSADHSFLIQADGSQDDEPANRKDRVRECGPYLLGNVEVRMSEVNGTISIWGKELSQEAATETEKTEKHQTEAEKKACYCCHKTPQLRLNGSPLVCSTSKKPKVSIRSNSHNGSQYMHPTSSRAAFLGNENDEQMHVNSTCSPHGMVSSCENGDPITHCKRHAAQSRLSNSYEKLHSYCAHPVESSEKECGCHTHQNKMKFHDPLTCSKEKFTAKYNRRNYRNSPERNRNLCESMETCSSDVEITCKHNSCRCATYGSEANCQQQAKCCNTIRDVPHICKSSPANTSSHNNTEKHSCNYSPFNDNEEEPLISHSHSHEPPEVRQRRVRGKKVRGILMDLFRGCGDCRNTSVTTGGKGSSRRKQSSYFDSVPEIKVSQCDPAEASCSNSAQPGGRCCRTYANRIESQLEEFRMEMIRVRSRSDAILDMLSMLHSVDMN